MDDTVGAEILAPARRAVTVPLAVDASVRGNTRWRSAVAVEETALARACARCAITELVLVGVAVLAWARASVAELAGDAVTVTDVLTGPALVFVM